MYVPKHFEETRRETLLQFLHDHPLGTLITLDSGGLNANHIPFETDPQAGPFGTLRGHVARGNPVWRDVSPGVDALVVFQGASAYISPSLYPTKQEAGKVVPTYNYIAVHASGPMKVIDDAAWLLALVEHLTNRHEHGRKEPWKVSDAPKDYIEKMLGAIVGIEIPIAKLLGKWKVSQNQPEANRDGVARGLSEPDREDAAAMAAAVMAAGRSQSA